MRADVIPPALVDAIETSRLRLLSAGILGGRGVTLALAGSGRGAGVSTVCIGLAQGLLRGGQKRVLLVDGTPLGQRASARLRQSAPALPSSALVGAADGGSGGNDPADGAGLAAAVTRPQEDGPHLLTLSDAPDPALREARGDAWSALCSAYDTVVVDAGALSSDTPFRWGGWVDHTVLIIDTLRVTRETMSHQRRALEGGGLRLAGFILNKRKFHVPAALYRALR
jgi:Mrp family chromosome partitioning ATPase